MKTRKSGRGIPPVSCSTGVYKVRWTAIRAPSPRPPVPACPPGWPMWAADGEANSRPIRALGG